MTPIEDSDTVALVIIGAGLSGLSALTVARKYVPKSENIVIADTRNDYGGQWLDAYDFVRLHQPYGNYTAFNQAWDLEKPRTHLATRDEVLNHLRDLARRASPLTLFGHRYISHEKVADRDDLLEVTFENMNEVVDEKEKIVKVKTKRLLKATPFKHITHKGFRLSSSNVQSIDITELSHEFTRYDRSKDAEGTHYIIVGSGKSAMDAINYIHARTDTKKTPLSLISGHGVAFFRRDKIFPPSTVGSWFGGHLVDDILLQYSLKWDGTNQASLMRELEQRDIFVSPVENPRSCAFGILSMEELKNVKEAVGETIRGRMLDIVDSSDGNELQVLIQKTGEVVPLKLWKKGRRTVVVNCTQLYDDAEPLQPILCDQGKTLNAQLVFFLPGPSTTFLTHAWFLNKLEGENGMLKKLLPLQVSTDPSEKDTAFFKLSLIGTYNIGVLAQNLPTELQNEDKSNTANWFPFWRRAISFFKLQSAFPKLEEACKLLDSKRYPIEK